MISRTLLVRGLGLIGAGLLFASCSFGTPTGAVNEPPQPTATTFPLFSNPRSGSPEARPTTALFNRVTPLPTAEPTAESTSEPTAESTAAPTLELTAESTGEPTAESTSESASPPRDLSDLVEASIFDDALNPNWMIGNSSDIDYNFAVQSPVFTGTVAGEVVPKEGFGTLLFSVREGSGAIYPRDDVVALSFQLSGGPGIIETGDLAVSIVGSDAVPYWVPNDDSVQVAGRVTDPTAPLFSETRLYYLGITRAIPPNTWVEVLLYLDDREFDPDYAYVTGVTIKNDELFRQSFFIDDMKLLMLAPPEARQ